MTQQENLAAFRAKGRELVAVKDAAAIAYDAATTAYDAATAAADADAAAYAAAYAATYAAAAADAAIAYADATAIFDAACLRFLMDSGAAGAEYVGNKLRIPDEGEASHD